MDGLESGRSFVNEDLHEIEFVIKSSPGLGNGSCIWKHANRSLNLGLIWVGHTSWRLVIDSNFESSWTPIDKLNSSFCFNLGNRSIDIFWNNIAPVKQAASHVFTWIKKLHSSDITWIDYRDEGRIWPFDFVVQNKRSLFLRHSIVHGVHDHEILLVRRLPMENGF